jgi:hypothetical protein
MVLVRRKAFEGKHKINDRWENEVYEVDKRIDEKLPVYRVISTKVKDKERTLHRNMLLPLAHYEPEKQDISLEEEPELEQLDSSGPLTRSRTGHLPPKRGADAPENGTFSKAKGKTSSRALLRANLVMNEHFDQVVEFIPVRKTWMSRFLEWFWKN